MRACRGFINFPKIISVTRTAVISATVALSRFMFIEIRNNDEKNIRSRIAFCALMTIGWREVLRVLICQMNGND